jgi:YidC/Oxa1 family membrane protein insertase
VRQTQSRQATAGSPVNAQMQAVTKIMPVFFGVISYGFSSATTIYFLVSNVWRIGQQHFVLNKMYEEEHAPRFGTTTGTAELKEPDPPPSDASSRNGSPGPSPHAARRKKKKRKR